MPKKPHHLQQVLQETKLKTSIAIITLGIFAVITFGLIWFFFLGPDTPVGIGWYLFSFASGLSMIVLPCTLPLAFVIVPLSMGKGAAKGLGIALMFGLGVAIMLSIYGIIAAVIGEVAIGTLGAPLEVVKNWLYLFAGLFAYLFALGEIGLIKFRMPTYTGSAPAFIQKQQDYIKALLLGLFLGNVGVGCPHPATPVLLTRIAASGDVFYGWLLFFVHAVGRVLPLLLLALLGILGVNALSWLVQRKDKIERATGWAMVFVAAFILVLGLFSHDWWVYSGQHTLLEEITGEEKFLGIIIDRFNLAGVPHTHGMPTGTGLFGLPLWLGNWALVLLWVVPIWWAVIRREKALMQENRGGAALPKLGAGLSSAPSIKRDVELKVMPYALANAITITLLFIAVFVWALPARFYNQELLMMREEAAESGEHSVMLHEGTLIHEESEITEGIAVNFSSLTQPLVAGTPADFAFFVNTKPENIPIPASSLQIDHEKLMHVIGVRDDLNEFLHIHPSPTSTEGVLAVNYAFKNPGKYKLWSEITKDGILHAFGHPMITVSGPGNSAQKMISYAKSFAVDSYQAVLDYDAPIAKDSEAELIMDIHDFSGNDVTLEQYLGTPMHLTIIKDDLSHFIHTHPEGAHTAENQRLIPEAHAHGEEATPVNPAHGVHFRVKFPEEGTYKLFAQFRPQGIGLPADEALTASLWVKVEATKPFSFSNWWVNLAVSIILIMLLGMGVKRYLAV